MVSDYRKGLIILVNSIPLLNEDDGSIAIFEENVSTAGEALANWLQYEFAEGNRELFVTVNVTPVYYTDQGDHLYYVEINSTFPIKGSGVYHVLAPSLKDAHIFAALKASELSLKGYNVRIKTIWPAETVDDSALDLGKRITLHGAREARQKKSTYKLNRC